jgi:hypothetical protein
MITLSVIAQHSTPRGITGGLHRGFYAAPDACTTDASVFAGLRGEVDFPGPQRNIRFDGPFRSYSTSRTPEPPSH